MSSNALRQAPLLDPANVAITWLLRHGKSLDRVAALEGCIEHLMSDHLMSEPTAEVQAMQAYAELNSLNQVCTIDAELTTAYVVVLRTADGRPVMFTAGDLAQVLASARVAGRARVVNNDARSPVVVTQ